MNKRFKIKPELIIFDADGVLVDSEIIAHQINEIEMTRLGFPITTQKSIELFAGITKDDFNAVMLQEYGRTIPDADLIPLLKKADDTIITEVKSIGGISEVLDYVEKKQIKKCIASNGASDYVFAVLTTTNLNKYFELEHIFSATMVNFKGKPEPDVFLLAASHFNVKPEDCLVIEDSVLGIKAAKAANMPVIGFLGGSHAQNIWYHEKIIEAGPTVIVNNAIELLDFLKEYG